MAIKVITDSTAYLSEKQLEVLDISRVSLSVVFEEEVFKETDISNDVFYNKMSEVDYFPTSSQPSIEELRQLMEAFIKQGHEIVGVFLSSEMSGTFSSANMVKMQLLEQYEDARIELIDSRTNCMQLGVQVLAGAKKAKEGHDIEAVIRAIEETKDRSRFIFVPENLDYLRKGGRIGMAQALVGNLLKLKPILTVNKGKTDSITTVRTRGKSIDKLIELFENDISSLGVLEVYVHHINCYDQAEKLALRLKEKTGLDVEIRPIGPVIGVHVGPGAIGLVYTTKSVLGVL